MSFETDQQCAEFNAAYEEHVRSVAQTLMSIAGWHPQAVLILGTGQQELVDKLLTDKTSYPYEDLQKEGHPFPIPGSSGHRGRFHFGVVEGVRLMIQEGRQHYYERQGLTRNVDFLRMRMGMDVAAAMGVRFHIGMNAAGGCDPAYEVGDLVVAKEHGTDIPDITQGRVLRLNDLEGKPLVRFKDQAYLFDQEMGDLVIAASENCGLENHVHEGAYHAIRGPTFESPDQVRELARRQFTALGMSTIPEAIVARYYGIKNVCISLITNLMNPVTGLNITDASDHTDIAKLPHIIDRQVQLLTHTYRLYAASLK